MNRIMKGSATTCLFPTSQCAGAVLIARQAERIVFLASESNRREAMVWAESEMTCGMR
jgi:hypothetical protein